MSTGANNAMPLAIVVAGLAIGAGLYLGLRAQAPVVPVVPVMTPPVPVLAPPPVAPARPPSTPAQVLQQATEALRYQRAGLLAACFRPALAARPGLTMELVFNVTFDAQGRQLARGVVETPGTSTPELTACVLAKMVALQVPAPGVTMGVEVPLRFP